MLPRTLQAQRLIQLQEASSPGTALGGVVLPYHGWIRAVRDALGVSLGTLGVRLGLTAQGVANLERSEAKRSVRLSDLDRVAEALGCRVVYAFVPKTGRWEEENASAAHHSMDLEGQGIRKPTP